MKINVSPKVLVTGGAGFIGSHLVDALVASGITVRVIDNLSRGKLEFIESHISNGMVSFIREDVCNIGVIQDVLEGIEVVYHLAAQSNVMGAELDPISSFNSNVKGTINVLQAAQKAEKVRCFVFASSREVYGEPNLLPVSECSPLVANNYYGASKISAEAYCRIFDSPEFRVMILRLTNVYGPRDRGRVIPIFIKHKVVRFLICFSVIILFGEKSCC